MPRIPATRTAPILLAVIAAVPVAACGGDAATGAAELALADGWVRAEDSDMTAVFGTLVNEGDTDVTVVSGSSEAAGRVELHEVVMTGGEMVMQPKDDGFVVPAGDEHVLEPGGDHVMLMDLAAPIEPGADVRVALETADGDSFEFTVQAREFDGAEEEYDPEGEPGTTPPEGMSAEMSEE